MTLPIMIMTSPDAITWTWRPSPWDGVPVTPTNLGGGSVLVDVAWNGSLAVCVGQGNGSPYSAVGSSSDGVNWTERIIPALDTPGYGASGVAWSPTLGLWCISVPGITTKPGLIFTSPDAITWTARATPWDAHVFPAQPALQDIAWSPAINKFVAVGIEYNSNTTNRGHVVMTSPDGINWTSIDTPFDSTVAGTVYTMFYVGSSSSMVIVTGNAGSGMMTSTDGVTWTAQTPNTFGGGSGITWNGSLWVLAGSSNPYNNGSPVYHDIVATSPDGVTWTSRATPWDAIASTLTNPFGYEPAWSATLNQWVMAGEERPLAAAPGSSHSILTSPDGITWTWHSTPFDTGATSSLYGAPRAAVWAASLGLWIAVGIGYMAQGFGWTIGDGWGW